MKHFYQIGILFLSFLTATGLSAQINADNTIPISTLVNEIFNTGTFVEVSNVTFNGLPADDTLTSIQIGLFGNGFSDGLPVDSGFAMTTGDMVSLFTNETGSFFVGDTPDDPDIIAISGFNVNDCAVLEFDVLNLAEALAFNFTFASIEYQSFTCSQFNDAFGLFISGPGISGPFENGAINIALIPGSDTPIAINTVNSGTASGFDPTFCEEANPNWIEDSQYFIENAGNVVSNVMFNGFTVNLEAFVEVEQNETYHIKFAICDAVDTALDSGIILEANSFEGKFLSVFDQNRPEQLKLYPNPSTDQVYIEIPTTYIGQNLSIRILDLQGRVVSATSVLATGTVEIETGQLEKGLYLIETAVNGKVFGLSKLLRD
ncbi:choice-of-anchor L domain-containing protein [Cryomorphaceae bacterium 1068]|nr:choice-of-anchor L domain-containing protein [Cryomorphaceae bacterium 1068]